MVTRSFHGVTDSIADAFTVHTKRSRSTAEIISELNDIRRLSRMSREKLARDMQKRNRPVSQSDIERAVLRALHSGEDPAE